MRLKNVGAAVLVCTTLFATRASHASTVKADTLKLVSTSSTVVDDVYVYPYNMSVDGSSTTTPMMCINYNDHVTDGEQWDVTSQQLSTSSTTAQKEDAWLFSQVGQGTYSNADIQFAVWYIMDSTDVKNLSGYDSTARTLVSLAASTAGTLTNSFLNQYEIYSPVNTSAASLDWQGNGLPQSFIAKDPAGVSAVTPEPSSLLLLATGMFGAATTMVRRRKLGSASTI